MTTAQFTPGNFGVVVLDKHLGSDEPRQDGAMVVTPTPAEKLEWVRARETKPLTSRRIALLEASHYVSHEECVANARLFAAAKKLLAACELVLAVARETNTEEKFGEAVTNALPTIVAAVDAANRRNVG